MKPLQHKIIKLERWKKISDFPDYAISTMGKIMRISKGINTKIGKILKPVSNGQYLFVNINNGKGKIYKKKIHRLVLETFAGLPPLNCECNHRDGVKTNNYLWNLE